MSPTHQDLSNDTTFNQIKSRVPVPLRNGCRDSEILLLKGPMSNLQEHFYSVHIIEALKITVLISNHFVSPLYRAWEYMLLIFLM